MISDSTPRSGDWPRRYLAWWTTRALGRHEVVPKHIKCGLLYMGRGALEIKRHLLLPDIALDDCLWLVAYAAGSHLASHH